MVRKSFKAATRETELDFETSEGEVFHARPKLAAGVILKFTDIVAGDDENMKLTDVIKALKDFFKGAIMAEDYDRFIEMLDDPEKGIALDELMDIAGWLAGVYTTRPTGTDSQGTSPTSPTGTDSTDGASPAVLTFSRKEQENSQPVGSSL